MEDAGVILVFLTACVVLFLFSRSVADFVDKSEKKMVSVENFKTKKKKMNGFLLFLLLLALGGLCYWFYFKCVDWFEKI